LTFKLQAVESLNKIAESLPAEHFEEHFIPLIRRLAKGEWFTSRTSACGLFGVAYNKVSDSIKAELRRFSILNCGNELITD